MVLRARLLPFVPTICTPYFGRKRMQEIGRAPVFDTVRTYRFPEPVITAVASLGARAALPTEVNATSLLRAAIAASRTNIGQESSSPITACEEDPRLPT